MGKVGIFFPGTALGHDLFATTSTSGHHDSSCGVVAVTAFTVRWNSGKVVSFSAKGK